LRFIDEVAASTTGHARLATDLSGRMETLQEPEYRELAPRIHQARREAEQAIDALLKHQDEHGC
jgi:hypothetical protein